MLIDFTSPLWYIRRVGKLNKVGATFALVILLILQIDEMISYNQDYIIRDVAIVMKNSVKLMLNVQSIHLSIEEFIYSQTNQTS